jgi:hypothetical protein
MTWIKDHFAVQSRQQGAKNDVSNGAIADQEFVNCFVTKSYLQMQ